MSGQRHKLKQVLPFFFALVIYFTFLFFMGSCSPQKRLDRLIKNHPDLAALQIKIDTVVVPQIKVDTIVMASTDTKGVDSLLTRYLMAVDSVQRSEAKRSVKNYIINRPCMLDTLIISIPPDGMCKVWQSGGKFHFRIRKPGQQIIIKTPQMNISQKIVRFWPGFSVGFIACFAVLMAFGYYAQKR